MIGFLKRMDVAILPQSLQAAGKGLQEYSRTARYRDC